MILSGLCKNDIKLIDPNPYNQHCIFDLAKTMLSLWIGYEFVYFDFFEIATELGRDGQVVVDVVLKERGCMEQYAVAADKFTRYARKRLAKLIGVPQSSFDRVLRLGAALTAMAIPSFHLIRHNQPDRALAFLALGLVNASYALDDVTPDSALL